MAASCAVCLKPITGGNDFVIAGTEAVHRGCVTRIEQSIGWRTKRAVAQLKTQLDRANDEVVRLREHDNTIIEGYQREINTLRERVIKAERDAITQGRNRDVADARRRVAEGHVDTLIVERDAARRELAIVRTLGESTTVVTPVAETAPKEDHQDASEKRFSLLELD